MKKVKICYILPHFYPHIGGGEQAFLNVIENMKNEYKNIDLRVVTSASGGICGYHKYKNISIYSYNFKMLFGHPIVRCKDLVEHVKWADIVHTSVYSPVIPTKIVASKYNKPLIITVHESLNNKWFWVEENKIKALLFKLYEKVNVSVKCECYHVPSEASKRDLLENNKSANIKRIYWISDKVFRNKYIDKKSFYNSFGVSEDVVTFLYYGRAGQTKGIFLYEKAIELLKKKYNKDLSDKVKFCFVISNEPKAGLRKFEKYMIKNKLDDLIKINTNTSRSELMYYIECADYVVVPSITEGFGLSAIEACERGRKLIHSDGGSLPEVTYGECISFQNRNASDLANVLDKVINGCVKFSKKKKKDFSSKTIVREFYEMYLEVMGKYDERKNKGKYNL